MAQYPLFRQTVTVHPRESAPHLFLVQDPNTRRSYTFQDFEISLARLLNGQRSLPQVVVAAQELGIPVSERGLGAFVAKLRAQGLLDEDGAGAPPFVAPFPSREPWPQAVRDRFLEALRAYRNGKAGEAEGIIDALLARNPDNEEARRLLEALRSKKNGRVFNEVFAETEASWARDAIRPPDPEAFEELPRGKSKVVPFVALAALGLIVGGLLFPLPYEITGKATLVPANQTEIKLEKPLILGEVVAKEGDRVQKGALLAKLDTAKLEQAIKDADVAVKDADRELRKERLALKGPKIARAKKAAALLEQKVAFMTTERDRKKAAGGPALDAAEKKLARFTEALTATKALLAPPTVAAAEKKFADATARVEMLKAQQTANTGLLAPSAGFVGKLTLTPGQEVAAGSVVGNIVDPAQLKATVEVAANEKKGLAVDQPVSLEVPTAGKASGKLTAVDPKPEALIENTSGNLRPGTEGKLTVNAGKRSTLSKLFQ